MEGNASFITQMNAVFKLNWNLMRSTRCVNLLLPLLLILVVSVGAELKKVEAFTAFLSRIQVTMLFLVLFLPWLFLLPLPSQVRHLIRKKQDKLSDVDSPGDSWMTSYIFCLKRSTVHMIFVTALNFAICGPDLYEAHDYTLQFVSYFGHVNLQIAYAFLFAGLFSDAKTASRVARLFITCLGLLGIILSDEIAVTAIFPAWGWLTALIESLPGFDLYSMSHEFIMYGIRARELQTSGMKWENLNDNDNYLKRLLMTMVVQWLALLSFSYYLDSASPTVHVQKLVEPGNEQPENADVAEEWRKVNQLPPETSAAYPIICYNVKISVGDPPAFAIKGLFLALPAGQCFAMVGPSGSGKTSLFEMLTGSRRPSFGTAYVEGNVRTQDCTIFSEPSPRLYSALFRDQLTGRENLLFFAKIVAPEGSSINHVVEESLKFVNLTDDGAADMLAGEYSSCMKMKLSIALLLIGDPKVVIMDEPTAGLDSNSRSEIWQIIKRAKTNRTVFLTTKSMEEAENLCDRLGILVDGTLQCLSTPKQLKDKHGGYELEIRTPYEHEERLETFVRRLSPNSKKTYHSSGVLKFELREREVEVEELSQTANAIEKRLGSGACEFREITLHDIYNKIVGSQV